MNAFHFDEEKAVNVVLFILKELGKSDRHQLAKILYFADQKHLVKYGRTILGDTYIKMPNGPVPSAVYDGIKAVNKKQGTFKFFEDSLNTDRYFITPSKQPDMDEMSESEIECISESIHENASLSFDQLTKKSHDIAYNNASNNRRISITKIAEEGGASKGVIEHILDSIHDIHLSERYGLIR